MSKVNIYIGDELIAKGEMKEFKPQKSQNFKENKDFIKKLNEPITQKKLNFADWFTIFLLVAIMLGIVGLLFLDWI